MISSLKTKYQAMSADDLLSDRTFEEIFSTDDLITRADMENALYERAKDVKKLDAVKRKMRAYEKTEHRATKNQASARDSVIAFPKIDVFDPGVESSYIKKRLLELQPEEYEQNDKGSGRLYADAFKDILRFDVTAKEWRFFDGKRWIEDTGGMYASRYGKLLSDELLFYAVNNVSDAGHYNGFKIKYTSYVLNLGRLSNRKTMIEDARDSYFVNADMLDQGIFLLNTQNAVLDLQSGIPEAKEHAPDMLLTKICNAEYRPEVRSSLWEKVIDDVMEGNEGKKRYLQKKLGRALTGETCEEEFDIFHRASTRNGKSTILETVAHILGGAEGYALTIKPESLAVKHNADGRQASGDIARLKGCRLLISPEPPKRMLLDVELLKQLTGRDTITARHMHQREIQFKPEFKLFMNTNHLPVVGDDTIFASDRIRVLEFNRHFEPHEQDKQLKSKLIEPENMSGILNWLLEGYRLYREEGAEPPEEVKQATEDYRQHSDKLGTFIAEQLEPDAATNTKAGDVYAAYVEWCNSNGYCAESKGNFFQDLRDKGLFADMGTIKGKTCKNIVKGYYLKTEFDDSEGIHVPFDD